MELANQQERLLSDLSWLAGVWESEGWFSMSMLQKKVQGSQYGFRCGICNSDPFFIEEVAKILKSLNLAHYVGKWRKNGIGTKPVREIRIEGMKRVDKFLRVIFPFLRTKKDRAYILAEFIRYRKSLSQKTPYGEYERNLFLQLKDLNGRLSKVSSEIIRPTLNVSEDMIRSA